MKGNYGGKGISQKLYCNCSRSVNGSRNLNLHTYVITYIVLF